MGVFATNGVSDRFHSGEVWSRLPRFWAEPAVMGTLQKNGRPEGKLFTFTSIEDANQELPTETAPGSRKGWQAEKAKARRRGREEVVL